MPRDWGGRLALTVLALTALESSASSLTARQAVYVTACTRAAGPAWRAASEVLLQVLRLAEPGLRVELAHCPCSALDLSCFKRLLHNRDGWPTKDESNSVEMAMPITAALQNNVTWDQRGDPHDMGDAAPPTRRVCRVRAAPASPALPGLDSSTAVYKLTDEDIVKICNDEVLNCTLSSVKTGGCRGAPNECGVALVEARELKLWMRTLAGLPLRLLPLAALPAREPLPGRRLLLCAWAPEYSAAAPWLDSTTKLATPPCPANDSAVQIQSRLDCPFETQRLMKVSSEKVRNTWPRLSRALRLFTLTAYEMRELASGVTASQWMVKHEDRMNSWVQGRAQSLEVLVLIPNSGAREAYDGVALSQAVTNVDFNWKDEMMATDMIMWVGDDHCSNMEAARKMQCELSSSTALSVVVGPACGAAVGGVQALARRKKPLLSYTWAASAGTWEVRGAGPAAAPGNALAALMRSRRWRRVAALTEPAWAPAWQALESYVPHVLKHTLLNSDKSDEIDTTAIEQWAAAAAGLRARILVVLVEDARVARAALCAGWNAGLRPRDGAVWLLPATLRRGWLGVPAPDVECDLRLAAEGHLSVRPAWLAPPAMPRHWKNSDEPSDTTGTLDPHAALLYDMLNTLLRALMILLNNRGALTFDEVQSGNVTRSILEEIEKDKDVGLTGRARWQRAEDGSLERIGDVEVLQWHAAGGEARVARWGEAAGLRWDGEPPRWATADGAVPGDGEPCALQAVADSLAISCDVAAALLAAVSLAALLAALVVAYVLVRRQYNKRLRELESRAPTSPREPQLDPVWELAASDVVINHKLGEGAFGVVYYGSARLPGRNDFTMVAVKQLRRRSHRAQSLLDRADFLHEAETMKQFDHPNVVKLLGVVTLSGPVSIVMELARHGSLKGWLLARREAVARGSDDTSPARLTVLAAGAARALSYLAEIQYVHCDVAARNCLVAGDGHLLLSDFGLTRSMYDRDYYVPGRHARRPVRWMAPEALTEGRHSSASDVWALGVLIYEIVTFGAVPYPECCDAEVTAHVQRGAAPEPPPGLRPQLKGMLRACWRRKAQERPGACEVAALLGDTRPPLLSASLLAAAACDTHSTGLYDASAPQDSPVATVPLLSDIDG